MSGTYLRLNVRVSESWRDVVRKASRKINFRHRTGRDMRTARHVFYREMLEAHRLAQRIAVEYSLARF